MALPNVTFCTITRNGSAIIVDVQTDEESSSSTDYSPLVSDKSGLLKNLVVVCGTAEAQEGSVVTVGQTLIGAYKYSADRKIDCLAVGFAEIECTQTLTIFADCESEQNTADALNAPLLYTDNVTSKSYCVKASGEGVVYEVTFSYLHTLSINLQ
jgi:hypothetical protein